MREIRRLRAFPAQQSLTALGLNLLRAVERPLAERTGVVIYEIQMTAADMDKGNGDFTADDFRLRAVARGLPLHDAATMAPGTPGLRGDHELNGGFLDHIAPDGYRMAAVLVPIIDRPGEASVLLTRRSADMPSHAGQIAFPGGKMEDQDKTIVDTALREAREETGLAPELVQPLARLDSYHTRTGFRIVPILGVVAPGFTLVPDAREVEDVFEVPLQFLMNVANHQRHSMEWQGRQRYFYAMPYGERYIWGATAGILRMMYERLYAE
jgi:8-oxo-dGTP pyrophosphatase MutT (NUDIX family)